MASTWGGSWGSSWGVSWDRVFVPPVDPPQSLGGRGHRAERLQDLPTWGVEVSARLLDDGDTLTARAAFRPVPAPLVVRGIALGDDGDTLAAEAHYLRPMLLADILAAEDLSHAELVDAIKLLARVQMQEGPRLVRDGPPLIRGRA